MNAKDMSKVYRHMKTDDLVKNLLRKRARRYTIRNHQPMSYLDLQELRRVEFHIKQMEVELAARAAQLNLI